MSSLPAVAAEGSPSNRSHGSARAWILRGIAFAVVIIALYIAVRDADIVEILAALGRLQAWQLGLLLVVDAAIHSLMACRWWIIVRTEDRRAPYPPMLAMRLAAFGISYFTLGPQVGGEPLQLLYLRQRRQISIPRAAASVLMDKLLELLANFFLLILALEAIPRAQVLGGLPGLPSFAFALLLLLAAWPPLHIILLARGKHPLSTVASRLPGIAKSSPLVRHVRAAERLAGQFCRRHPRSLLSAVLVSLAAAGMSVMEYGLITSFIVSRLSFWQNVSAWSAGWLSFLFPTPAGLGALEASQVLALGAFGFPSSLAIAVALVMRARDLVFGGTGLIIAAVSGARLKSKPSVPGVLQGERP